MHVSEREYSPISLYSPFATNFISVSGKFYGFSTFCKHLDF